MAARVERYSHTDGDGVVWTAELDITMSGYASWSCGCASRPRGMDGGGYGKHSGDARYDARHHHLMVLSDVELQARLDEALAAGDGGEVGLCRDEIESRTRRGQW